MDPYNLKKPADYDDYWYTGEDGYDYNEYDDKLEEGYYYGEEEAEIIRAEAPVPDIKQEPTPTYKPNTDLKEASLPAASVSKGFPKPADYEDYWYEGDDGLMYNEYDDELEEGQFYEDIVVNGTAKPVSDKSVKANATSEAAKAADDVSKAADEATKAAEEAAKAAADASKKLLKGMSGMGGGLMDSLNSKPKPDGKQTGFGFGGFGGLFGAAEPPKKQLVKPAAEKQPAAVKPVTKPLVPEVQTKPVQPAVVKPKAIQEQAPKDVVVPEPKPIQTQVMTTKKAVTADDLLNKPFTARMTARERWKWAYSMARQVNWPSRSTQYRTTLLVLCSSLVSTLATDVKLSLSFLHF